MVAHSRFPARTQKEIKGRGNRKSPKVKPVLHSVHRAEENGQNNYYGDLTNKGKLV
jgi:hypothetical protein